MTDCNGSDQNWGNLSEKWFGERGFNSLQLLHHLIQGNFWNYIATAMIYFNLNCSLTQFIGTFDKNWYKKVMFDPNKAGMMIAKHAAGDCATKVLHTKLG